MARTAFIMDRVMSKVGLHGKSFIPLLSSFCLRDPRNYVGSNDRKSERPVGHDPCRAVDELFGASACLHYYDRGLDAGGDGDAEGGHHAGDVCHWDCGRVPDGVVVQENIASIAKAGIYHGASAVPLAVVARGRDPHVGTAAVCSF